MVSIIVPAYNVAKYIRECLDSALGQTCREELEVIVVDDGSTDRTPEIIREYAARDPRVRLLTQQNRGPSEARNAALAVASGEWIVCLDSDDILLPGAVDRLLEVACGCGADYVEASWIEGIDPESYAGKPFRRGDVELIGTEDYIERVLYQDGVCPAVWGKLFDRKLFDGLAFREGILYEDLDFFYHLAGKARKIAIIPDKVYFYRQNTESLTHVFTPQRFDVLEATERIEKYVSENYPSILPAARDRRLSANFNMFGLIAVHDREGRYVATAEECWTVIKSYRRESLLNPKVRLKNKLGILVSYMGCLPLRLLTRIFYGRRVR